MSWITRYRRTVRDYELPAHHETYVYWAMIIVMTRRLARQPTAARPTPARVLKQALRHLDMPRSAFWTVADQLADECRASSDGGQKQTTAVIRQLMCDACLQQMCDRLEACCPRDGQRTDLHDVRAGV